MAERKFHLHDGKRGVAMAVRVTPRASRNEVTAIQEDGTVKVRLASSPKDGDSNAALVRYLAEVLGVVPSKIEIVAGESGRDKLISILDMDKDELQNRLMAYIG
jgi:uncharacterized protein (TIGR00251 family)